MARWEPLVACSAASLHLAALASYFSTLVWRSVSMALVPHAKLHSREPDTSARSKRWHVLGDFVASRAASPRGAAVTAPIPVLLRADKQLLLLREPACLGCLRRFIPQATPRRRDLCVSGAMAARPHLGGRFRIFRHIVANHVA